MKLLLTNDDGIRSESLLGLADRLSREHRVWVIAPAQERSACSHALSIKDPVSFRRTGERMFACEGTTADCVLIALRGFIKDEIDAVVSGINYGPNLGTDIIYSGTAAGARQAALMGKPSVAASSCSRESGADHSCEIEFIARNIELFAELWSPGHFININFPLYYCNCRGVAVTFPARRKYDDRLVTEEEADGSFSVRVEGEEPGAFEEAGSDYDAVSKSLVSITPVQVHPGIESDGERYRIAKFWIPVSGDLSRGR